MHARASTLWFRPPKAEDIDPGQLVGFSRGLTVTLGDDPTSGPQWKNDRDESKDTDLIGTFVRSFNKTSGSATLRDVVELMYTVNPTLYPREKLEWSNSMDSARSKTLKAIDNAINSFDTRPEVQEVSQVPGNYGQDANTGPATDPDQEQHNRVPANTDNTSLTPRFLETLNNLLEILVRPPHGFG